MFEPSAQIESLLTAVALRQAASAGMRAMMERESEFPSPLEAKLTGIALDPNGRDIADQALDASWSDEPRQQNALSSSSSNREVIVGSGFHAAVYAAVRVLCGYPKPLVLERNERVGGTFAMTARPTFFLNSRNRAGSGGLAGDQGASLNYLPGAPIQAANVSMVEYQTNTDMAFVIRLALAQFADVVTNAKVLSVARDGTGVEIDIADRDQLLAGRVIDARGLGDPDSQDVANGTTILTFPQFMQRMASMWPLRGVRRVAVIGGGDSAKCAVESFLGSAPQPFMAAAALDSVDRIGLYPLNCCCSAADSYCLSVRYAYLPGRWVVFWYDTEGDPPPSDDLVEAHRGLLDRLRLEDLGAGQPFLLGPDGRPDVRVNAFFTSRRMRARSPLTWKKYAYSLGLWLNFLLAVGRRWDSATEDDAEHFKEWRLTDRSNPRPVETSTFAGDLAALRSFYRWAARAYGVVDPVAGTDDLDLRPHGVRDRDIKWFDPAGYRRWRDLGLRGHDFDGRPDPRWRGRNDQRDVAFADGLYGSGLRLVEWASVLLIELPEDDPARGYTTSYLADACAKGGYGHRYWLPRTALLGVLDYVEGARAKAMRQAQQAGRYQRVRRQRLLLGEHGGRLSIQEPDGRQTSPALNAISPRSRARLFRPTSAGLEPLALWLNEDGMPRAAHGWEHTFAGANARIARMGLPGFTCSPHMLRHSCALRWYAVGRLAYERRFAHLDEEEQRDFRAQFGNTWDLVATMLGHRSPETTRRHYLEPFRTLELELLLHHAQQAAVDGFLTGYLADHPLVRTDPLGLR